MAKRRKVGHIEPSPGGGWDVRVTRGTTSDGRARTLCRHVDGTFEDADAACYALAAELGRSLAAGDSVTLAQYYRGIFRNAPSNRGRPRSRSTLRAYDAQMERHVLPEIGDVPLSRLSHGQIKAAVLGAGSPRKCKETLRAVLRAAYDDGLLEERPMERRIVTPRKRRPQVPPWDAAEAAEALSALEGYRRHEIEAYLILGLSGLRTEEALAASPSDVSARETYDLVTGDSVRSLTVSIRNTYTYDDGFREGTKTDFSERSMPVIVQGRARLLGIIAESRPSDPGEVPAWASRRIVDLSYNQLLHAWRRALREAGLRYIPPDMLRHTSETLMQAAQLPDTLVSRLHGHTDLRTDYRHYMRPTLPQAEAAARSVHKIMPESR